MPQDDLVRKGHRVHLLSEIRPSQLTIAIAAIEMF